MKLDPRTGTVTPEEALQVIQNFLEEKFKCGVKVWADIGVKTEEDPSDWRSEYPPSYRAVFKGYRFQLED